MPREKPELGSSDIGDITSHQAKTSALTLNNWRGEQIIMRGETHSMNKIEEHNPVDLVEYAVIKVHLN